MAPTPKLSHQELTTGLTMPSLTDSLDSAALTDNSFREPASAAIINVARRPLDRRQFINVAAFGAAAFTQTLGSLAG